MSLSNENVKTDPGLAGDGLNTTFAIAHATIDNVNTETKVWVRDTSVSPATAVLRTEGAGALQYSIIGANVEFVTAPLATDIVVIIRQLPLTAPLDLDGGLRFKPESQEKAYDRLAAQVQQMQEQLTRTPKLTVTEQTADPIDMPDPIAGRGLKWNPGATDLINTDNDPDTIAAAAAVSAAAALVSENNAATSETNAATSETNAATSETNAATSETNAATSETNAATSAANALTSENNAATSETNAATSETNAGISETNAAASAAAASGNESSTLHDLGLATSVAANALTIDLKQSDGSTDPTLGEPVVAAFNGSTAADGDFDLRTKTSAETLVVSSGSTLGTLSGIDAFLYLYALDNAGAIELGISMRLFDEGSLQTSVAEGGAGAADDGTVLYSTAARANVSVRLIGRLKVNEATAGTWATAPSEVSLVPFDKTPEINEILLETGNGYGSSGTTTSRFSTVSINIGAELTLTQDATNGDSITVNSDGMYMIMTTGSFTAANRDYGSTINSSSTSTSIAALTSTQVGAMCRTDGGGGDRQNVCTVTLPLLSGAVIRHQTDAGVHSAAALQNRLRVVKVGPL